MAEVSVEIPFHSLATSSTWTRSALSISLMMVSVFVIRTGFKPPGMSITIDPSCSYLVFGPDAVQLVMMSEEGAEVLRC